jgi:hypothetical protein
MPSGGWIDSVESVLGTDDTNITAFVRETVVPSSPSYTLYDNDTATDQTGLYSNLQANSLYLKIDGCACVISFQPVAVIDAGFRSDIVFIDDDAIPRLVQAFVSNEYANEEVSLVDKGLHRG